MSQRVCSSNFVLLPTILSFSFTSKMTLLLSYISYPHCLQENSEDNVVVMVMGNKTDKEIDAAGGEGRILTDQGRTLADVRMMSLPFKNCFSHKVQSNSPHPGTLELEGVWTRESSGTIKQYHTLYMDTSTTHVERGSHDLL